MKLGCETKQFRPKQKIVLQTFFSIEPAFNNLFAISTPRKRVNEQKIDTAPKLPGLQTHFYKDNRRNQEISISCLPSHILTKLNSAT